jgi:hypothetical protein
MGRLYSARWSERGGVYFVIKDEKAKEAEMKVKKWLQNIKMIK